MEIRHRRSHVHVDLETTAPLCSKCADELRTSRKDHRAHSESCPRSRNYRGALEGLSLSSAASSFSEGATHYSGAASASAAPEAAAAAIGLKRKRSQSQGDEEEDVDIGGGGTAAEDDDIDDNDDNDHAKLDSSKPPRRVGNSIDFPLSNLRPHLICSLCRGYFRDPYTVADCLHTFCRSCLILFFRQGMRCCPTCNTRLGPDPFHTSISIQSREVIPDRTLQEVVNKIFPWLKGKDDQEEREFYAQRGIELKPEYAQEDGVGSRVHHDHMQRGGIASTGNKSNDIPKAANDMLELHLEPSDEQRPHLHRRLPPLRNSYLCMSGRTKIVSLKKYLVQKLGLKESRSSIELLCNGDPMGDELSLTFILRTRWFLTNKVLTLHYRLEDETSRK